MTTPRGPFRITPPSRDQILRARLRCQESEDNGCPCDHDAIEALSRAMEDLAAEVHEMEPLDQLVELGAGTLIGAVRFNIAFTQDRSTRLGCLVLDEWLGDLGWHYTPSSDAQRALVRTMWTVPTSPGEMPDALLWWIKDWLTQDISDGGFHTLAEMRSTARPAEPIRAFLACRMTKTQASEICVLLDTSEEIARALSGDGILCYQPLRVHDPRVSRAVADDPANRVLDELQIASCDLVVVLGDRSATGLGVIASLALKYGAVLVVVFGSAPVTPMITGSVPRPIMLEMSEHLREDFESLLDELLPRLRSHAEWRHRHQQRASEEQREFKAHYDSLEIHPGDAAAVGLSRERVRQLLEEPDLFDGASRRELRSLEDLLQRRSLPPLSLDHHRALFHAENSVGWDQSLTPAIVEAGRRALARGGHQRLEAIKTDFWVDLYHRLYG